MFCPRCHTHATVIHAPTPTTVAVRTVRLCGRCGAQLVTPEYE